MAAAGRPDSDDVITRLRVVGTDDDTELWIGSAHLPVSVVTRAAEVLALAGLLDDDSRRLLTELAVFAPGFTNVSSAIALPAR